MNFFFCHVTYGMIWRCSFVPFFFFFSAGGACGRAGGSEAIGGMAWGRRKGGLYI